MTSKKNPARNVAGGVGCAICEGDAARIAKVRKLGDVLRSGGERQVEGLYLGRGVR